jgi:YidC/Oxa1 family membrane protein insertase
MWSAFVELLRATIFTAAHLFGGNLGAGIILVSAAVRLALLPLTLRVARQMRAQQLKLASLQPQLEKLQARHAKDPAQLLRKTQELHAQHGIRLFAPSTYISLGIQAPLLGGLFAAVRQGLGNSVRFLWVRDLARPDVALVSLVCALTAASFMVPPSVTGQPGMPVFMKIELTAVTFSFLWSMSSAMALSMGAGSLVSILQNWLLARDHRAPAHGARRT